MLLKFSADALHATIDYKELIGSGGSCDLLGTTSKASKSDILSVEYKKIIFNLLFFLSK